MADDVIHIRIRYDNNDWAIYKLFKIKLNKKLLKWDRINFRYLKSSTIRFQVSDSMTNMPNISLIYR